MFVENEEKERRGKKGERERRREKERGREGRWKERRREGEQEGGERGDLCVHRSTEKYTQVQSKLLTLFGGWNWRQDDS